MAGPSWSTWAWRSQGPHLDGGLTQSGVTLGTFDYISPEQALEPRDADSRSDIYSLGCTFYHMLTGQAPVPEGTAAKKLHHHQHVAPVDPRQLNPDVPDEVAAVLGRMMAKNPADRYPRPVHLVQHLLRVAQHVGAADDVPEGALFVDAPMPAAYRQRPMLLISLAALALALILAFLSLAPQPQRQVSGGKGTASHPDKPAIARDATATGTSAKSKLPASGIVAINNEQEFAQLFTEPGNVTYANLEASIELPESGLVFGGDARRGLTIDCKNIYEPKTIRFKYSNAGKSESLEPVTGLAIDGGILTFRNIHFEIEAHATPDRVVASLGIRGPSTVTFSNCVFVQREVPQRPFILDRKVLVPVASLAVDNAAGLKEKRPHVVLEQCSFTGGQVAVGITGPVELVATDCAFRPYGALFHLHGDNPLPAQLTLQRCSALVMNGPAFRLDEEATCELLVKHSIFSRPDNAPMEDRDEPDLIYQTDKNEPAVKFEGLRNCFHNLNALWVRPKGSSFDIRTEMDEFRTLVVESGGAGDNDSSRLTKETPIWLSATPWKEESLREAFKLRVDVREVRTADLKKALGFEKLGKIDPLAAFPAKDDHKSVAPVLKANEKLVDPDAAENAPAVFKSLFQALAFAEPGDVIYIRHGKNSREVLVEPMPLNKPDTDVTLKPFPGETAPILKLGKSRDSEEPAFFRMYDGKLAVEQLEFVLEPDQANLKTMTLVFMGGHARAAFKNCIITMKPSDTIKQPKRIPLSVVTLADPEVAMKMPTESRRTSPEIQVSNCFLRGEGDLLTVRASRALDLEINNTMLALAGSLVVVQAGTKELAPDAEARVRLERVSVLLTEPLFALHAGKGAKAYVPVRVDPAKNCLFVGLPYKPFVLLETGDAAEMFLHDCLEWKGEHNAYGFADTMLVMRQAEGGQSLESWDKARWDERFTETNARTLPALYTLPAAATKNLWQATPDFYAPKTEPNGDLSSYGAILYLDALPRLTPSKQ